MVDDPEAGTSWVCNRVLNDIDYWARTPNLYSAREKGLPLESVQPMLAWLRSEPSLESTDIPTLRSEIVTRVRSMFRQLVIDTDKWKAAQSKPEDEEIDQTADLWATAAQLTIGALSLRTRAYSKMETRRYIVAINRITYELLHLARHHPGATVERLAAYLLLAVGAVALDLAAEDRRAVMDLGLSELVGGLALCQEGVIVLDVRQPGTGRDFLLRLVMLVVANDVGSVGILQDGTAPVHNSRINGISLEILPCVTLYPGMESIFPGLMG